MALKDITGNFAASGSNQEYKVSACCVYIWFAIGIRYTSVQGGIVSEFGR